MMRGRYIFTMKDVDAICLECAEGSVRLSLSRMMKRGVIVSPWQNFYVAVPMEYKLKGEVPPSFYIDYLMKYLNREYYVSLLSAAALNGAGHQRAMVFQITANGATLRPGVKNGTRLEFIKRQQIPSQYINKVKVQTGYMNVSSPELTALDIVCNEERIGGLSRVAEIIVELAENMRWDKTKFELLNYFSTAVIQRLGYLLDFIEESSHADNLMALAKESCKTMRTFPLKQTKPVTDDMKTDKKWKIIVNQTIDIDEI